MDWLASELARFVRMLSLVSLYVIDWHLGAALHLELEPGNVNCDQKVTTHGGYRVREGAVWNHARICEVSIAAQAYCRSKVAILVMR